MCKETCKCISKFVLIIVNIVFLLAGIVMLGFGITAKVKPSLIFDFFENVPGLKYVPKAFDLGSIITGAAIFMIVIGCIVAATGFFGSFGACCENKCLLVLYAIVLVIVLCLQLALIIFAAVAPSKTKNELQKIMIKSLETVDEDSFVNENDELKLPNKTVSLAWATLQFETKCCGTYNVSDYHGFNHTVKIKNEIHKNVVIPLSCCSTNQDINLGKDQKYGSAIFVNVSLCLSGNHEFIAKQNCYDSVAKLIKKSSAIAIGIAVGIVVVEFILIVAAISLTRQTERK